MLNVTRYLGLVRASGCLAVLLVVGCGGASPGSIANLPRIAMPPGPNTVGTKDGSPAKSCRIRKCIYVAARWHGSQPGSVNVYPIDADGNVKPIWTISGPNSKIKRIQNLTLDVNRDVYIARTDSILVYARGAHGDVAPVRTIRGSNTGLDFPQDVAVDAHGTTYVANHDVDGRSSITVYAPGTNGNVTPIQTISGSKTTLNYPAGIAVDGQSNIYVLDTFQPAILVFTAGATGDVAPVRTIVSRYMAIPSGIAVSAQGAIYVGNSASCFYGGSGSCYGPVSSVLLFPVGAKGEVDHLKKIAGPKTKLSDFGPLAIALGPKRIYVTDGETRSLYVYGAAAHGNVAPIQTIFGPNTGFDYNFGPIGVDVR